MNNQKNVIATGVVIVVLVFVVAFGVIAFEKNRETEIVATKKEIPTSMDSSSRTSTDPSQTTEYKDGEYSATGSYTSPGGPEEINVTLTLENGVITDSNVQSLATRPESKEYQGIFASNYKKQVIGKNINQVLLNKVSGSSLTPKGFNNALEQIKQQAKV